MKNDKKRVARARRFIGGLALVMAMSGLSGCSFGKKNIEQNPSHSYESTIEDNHDHDHDHTDYVDETTIEDESKEEVVEEETKEEEETLEEENKEEEEENVEENTNDSTNNNNNSSTQEKVPSIDEELPNIGDYKGYSIVDALALAGYPHDFSYRKHLAEKLGIQNYRGTAEQNLQMLRLLREYSESLNNQGNDQDTEQNTNDNQNNNDNNGDNQNTEEEQTPTHEHSYKLVPSRTKYTNLGARGHRETKYYECSCGDVTTKTVVKAHNITTEQVHENETNDGYDLVTYEVCSTCGYKKEISREHVNIHNHVLGEVQYDAPVDNVNDDVNHDVTSYQECSTCHEKVNVRTLSLPHSYLTLPIRYDNGFEYVDEKCSECGHTHNLSVNPHIHTLDNNAVETKNEISGNDDQHEVISYETCTKCHQKVYGPTRLEEHNYSSWTYNSQTDKDERTCNDCGHTQSRTHEEEHTHTASEYRYKNYVELNDDDIYHNVTKYQVCTDCGEVISEVVIKQSHSYEEWSYNERLGLDERICSHCSHVEQRVHQHELSGIKYDTPEEIGGDDVNHNITSYQECTKCGARVNENTTTEAHTYGTWIYDETSGLDKQTCTGCGHFHTRTHVEDHTHAWSEYQYKNPTEIVDDDVNHNVTRYKKCSGCDEVSDEEVVTQAHTYGDSQTKVDGIYTVTYEVCTGCGHTHEISRVHEHTLGDVLYKDPVEIDNDDVNHKVTSYQVCSVCGETVNEQSTTQAHTYGAQQTKVDGIYTVTYEVCSGCGHTHEISRVHEHTLGDVLYKDPVEIEDNDVNHRVTSYQVCSVCGETVNEQSTTQAHTYGDWSYNDQTGKDERTCSDCGHPHTRTHEHTATHNVTRYTDKSESGHRIEVWKVCDDCSNDVERVSSENVSHSSLTAGEYEVVSSSYSDNGAGEHIYTEVRKCPDCGETWTYTNTVEHVWSGEEFTTYEKIDGDNERHHVVVKRHCSACDKDIEISRVFGEHSETSVEENGVTTVTCSDCGHSYTVSHTHTWEIVGYEDGKLKYYCDDCGQYKEEEHTHVYDDGPYYDDGKDEYRCSCGQGKELRDHTVHKYNVDVEELDWGEIIYHYTITCDLCHFDPIEDYCSYDELPDIVKEKVSIPSGASMSPVGFSARSYAAPAMVEDPEEEEQLPVNNEEEQYNEEQYNEEEYNEENYNMYVEFIENEYDIEGVNVYITPSSETEEENEEEKGAPVR